MRKHNEAIKLANSFNFWKVMNILMRIFDIKEWIMLKHLQDQVSN
jgi:hypothetical protein